MFEVEDLCAWYGQAQAVRNVSLNVQPGELVTLVGRNGAGKTTVLHCIMGLHPHVSGRISLNGADVSGWPAHRRARAGLGYVPDDRGIYASLTVEENLLLPPAVGPGPWSLSRVYGMFPALQARRRFPGNKLSGGEQQMLAIARVLRMGAQVLLLDEPTEGLAPVLVQQVAEILREVKAQGLTILLVEQNLRFATALADRHYLLSEGQIVETMDNRQVIEREEELLEHLGV
ncbi:MAG TPA: ABC transporter ATP-binding protein [Chloroflexota bacterium]